MNNFGSDRKHFLRSLLIGVIISLAVIIALMCLGGLIFTFGSSLPYEILAYLMLAVEAVGVFAGGYVAAILLKSRGLLIGLACGASVFLILLAAGLCADTGSISIMTLIRFLILPLIGMLSGVIGVNKKERIRIK